MSRRDLALPGIAAVSAFVLHLLANPHYGFFRDELYFIVCGRHPQFGYVDQPPVVPLLAAATQVFGPSLVALRAVPALCSAVSIFVTIVLARELGAGRYGQILAALVAFFSPVLMNLGMKISPDMIGLWTWPWMVLLIARLTKGADARGWLAAGALLGLSLESKYTVIFFAIAVLAGLLVTGERRVLRTPWFAAGIAVAASIALPNFLWQAHYGFPMLELLRNGANGKNNILSPLQFVLSQFVIANPILSFVWLAGLVWTFVRRELRWIGVSFVALSGLMLFFHAKDYYDADAFPMLFAAGAVAIESVARAAAARAAIALVVVLGGSILVPIVEPILPVPTFIAYMRGLQSATHLSRPPAERERAGVLPGDWADMHGWEELAATVARVYGSLPAAERARAAIVASNYGEAAALDFFGGRYGLAPALSGHNQYFLWGPRGYAGDVVIDVNGDCGAQSHLFRTAERVATFSAPYVQPFEDHLPIMICRGIRTPLPQLWPQLKRYI